MSEVKISPEQGRLISGEWNDIQFSISKTNRGWILKVEKPVSTKDCFVFLNEYVEEPGDTPKSVVLGLNETLSQQPLYGTAGLVRFYSDEELARNQEASRQGRGSSEELTGSEFRYGDY